MALLYIIFKWIRNSRQGEIPSIGVRYDVLSTILGGPRMVMARIMFDIDKKTTLNSIVHGVKQALWEYKMHGLEYGKDWELLCWETKKIYKNNDLSLKLNQLGIKKDYTLEVVAYFTKERADEIPNAPEAYINYGSLD